MSTESTLIDIARHLKENFEVREAALQRELLGGVDTYRIHKMMAARVTTAR
jgi:hypothetical protein